MGVLPTALQERTKPTHAATGSSGRLPLSRQFVGERWSLHDEDAEGPNRRRQRAVSREPCVQLARVDIENIERKAKSAHLGSGDRSAKKFGIGDPAQVRARKVSPPEDWRNRVSANSTIRKSTTRIVSSTVRSPSRRSRRATRLCC